MITTCVYSTTGKTAPVYVRIFGVKGKQIIQFYLEKHAKTQMHIAFEYIGYCIQIGNFCRMYQYNVNACYCIFLI